MRTTYPRRPVSWVWQVMVALAIAFIPPVFPLSVRADPVSASGPVVFADPAFRALWRRTDDLARGTRSYLWGPIDGAPPIIAREPYTERLRGRRDWSSILRRPGWNWPGYLTASADQTRARGFVTNGLLATEMITGKLQLGDKTFETRAPAAVTIAGDASDTDGPTYATFTKLTGARPWLRTRRSRRRWTGAAQSAGAGRVG